VTVEILDKAEDDLVHGFQFYETQQAGLGSYFLESLFADMESLPVHGGVHRLVYRNYHRALAKRSRLRSSTRFRATPCSFMRLLIADANRRGSPNI
jgi:hypothetical protein